jgi:hypothetical protein
VKPSTAKALRVLEEAGDRGLTTGELTRMVGTRFGARILELRRAGYVISEERIKANQSLYVLERQDGDGPIVLDFCQGAHPCCHRRAA